MMRTLPTFTLSDCPEDVARLCAQNWDTVQEALALTPTLSFVEILEQAQAQARDIGDSLEGSVAMELNGEALRMCATGAKGGFRFRLECDDFLIFIGSPKRDWTITARYLSAGLWEHGLDKLRERVFAALAIHTTRKDDDCVRVSRADWCFDFYAPAFTRAFVPGIVGNVVCHSSAKAQEMGNAYGMWGRAGHGETLTIGSKSGLQVQLYDKTREIDEASGKTWLYDVWAAGMDGLWPWSDRPRDMWRLECRFSGDFLKDRNLRRPAEIEAHLSELIAEALVMRRLTVPGADSNRARWPLHPMWSEAYRARGADRMVALGRKVTGRRHELRERAVAQIAGALRSATVLAMGEYKNESARALAGEAWDRITKDTKHSEKERAAQSRYSDVEDAR